MIREQKKLSKSNIHPWSIVDAVNQAKHAWYLFRFYDHSILEDSQKSGKSKVYKLYPIPLTWQQW